VPRDDDKGGGDTSSSGNFKGQRRSNDTHESKTDGDARQALSDDEREVTLGTDKGDDAKEFIYACVAMNVTPHVAQNTSGRKSAVPNEIAQIEGYAISQRKRKLIE